jgi:molybdate transport system ATP-binding protein
LPEAAHADRRDAGGRLEVALQYAVGAMTLEVKFELAQPWSVLFAPSGVGKSTVLRLIAGLLRPQRGRVARVGADEMVTVLTDTEAGIYVPAHRRGMGLVSQNVGLFPHMTVLRNVLYGVGSGEEARKAGDRRGVDEIMEMCRVAHLAGKMPAAISGGEMQRVALARAIVARPGCPLLLDEPFTGLDAALKEEIIRDFRSWMGQTGTTVLQVTHDLGDVLAAEAEVLVMENGRIVAQGPTEAVLGRQLERLRHQLKRR